MHIELTNIGMLKKACLDLDGLTVIAGENDTGKSTVGKVLFSLIKADNMFTQKQSYTSREAVFQKLIRLNFEDDISDKGKIRIVKEDVDITIRIENNKADQFGALDKDIKNKQFLDATIIQSPIVWDMLDFFSAVEKLKGEQAFYEGFDFDIKYPYIFWDLYKKLTLQRFFEKPDENISTFISNITGGQFKTEAGQVYFHKYNNHRKVHITNTAIGIKSFGIFQLLNENSYITKKGLFVLDEPEVHLHPEWQLKYAELIVELVKTGVCMLINSHSPYMVDALRIYSGKAGISDKTKFYLAEKITNESMSHIKDATHQMWDIFEKLSTPLTELNTLELDDIL